MNNETYWRPDLSEMASHYENDDTVDYIIPKVMPFKPMSIEKGSFRTAEEKAFFAQPNMEMSRTGYPNSFSKQDTTDTYNLQPFGGSFEFSNLELSQAAQLGYASQADMIASNVEWLSAKAKLDLEIRGTEFLQTLANYAAGFTVDINATSNKWSVLNASDPLKDVLAMKETLWGPARDIIIGRQMLHYLMQHSKITTSSTVAGTKRTGLDPNVTPEYLATYFGVQNVWVSGGLYDTTPNTPATMTKGWIWNSAYVWIGTLDKGTKFNPRAKSFADAIALQIPEMKTNFIAKETIDNRAGGVGIHFFDVVFYMQFKARQQKLGGLLYNCI
jgi:hypothetical protein